VNWLLAGLVLLALLALGAIAYGLVRAVIRSAPPSTSPMSSDWHAERMRNQRDRKDTHDLF